MLRLRALVVLVLFCALSVFLAAQAPGTGLYAFGSFDHPGFDTINIGNLNIHFEIPIVNKPGRGQAFNYSLAYDGLLWSAVTVNGVDQWQPDTGWGFHGQLSGATTQAYVGYLTYNVTMLSCQNYMTSLFSNYIYHDAFGQQHAFNYTYNECTSTVTGDGSSSDGSGYRYSNGDVIDRYGTKIVTLSFINSTAGTITDSNGNVISNNGDGTFTDTLGVTALTITGGGNANSPRVLTYKVAEQADGSTTAAATVSYVTYTIQTHFSCLDSSSQQIQEYGADGNTKADFVDRITLADGTYYKFNYEPTPGGVSGAVTGRLASVTLPTGGTISYQTWAGCNGLNSDGTTGQMSRTTADGTRYYWRSPSTNGSTTTLQDESGNQTVYTFTDVAGLFYETHRQVHNGGNTTPAIADVYTCYNGTAPPCDGGTITSPPITQTYVVSSKDGGEQEAVVNSFDGSSGLLTNTAIYNSWGQATTQTTSYSYVSPGRVSDIAVKDGSGNIVSHTIYGYDDPNSPLTATSNIPQHSAVSGPRGNQTSSHTWNSAGPNIDTTTTYYDTGVPISSTGPTGATQYTFESTTQGFLKQLTPPTPSSGISLPSYASYDVNSGIQLSASDANYPSASQVQYAQYDRLLRPKQVNAIDGGSIYYSYNSNQVGVFTTTGTGPSADTETLYDGYGRVSRVAVGNGQATNPYYQVDYCYDAVGNLHFQSTPYQGVGWGTPIHCPVPGTTFPGTTYTYDALGRVTNINNADGNTTYQYNSRSVLATDVNGVQKITKTDVLGRVTFVCEISSSHLSGDSPQNCGLDIAGTGYLTAYVYDLANHKTTITQGVQTRIFQTDSLGRPVSIQEPESGITTYSYTYGVTANCTGAGLCVTRTRPCANLCNNNVPTTTTTQYDTIGRPVIVTYSDGTPTKGFNYDTSAGWGSLTQTNLKGKLSAAYIYSPPVLWTATIFGYDSMGRVNEMAECLPSSCSQLSDKRLSFRYDLAGNMTSASDGAGTTTGYGYSPASEVTTITSSLSGTTYPSSLVSNMQNGPFGPVNYQLGNGLAANRVYDSTGRLAGGWICNGSTQRDCTGGTSIYGFTADTRGTRITNTNDTAGNWHRDYGYDEFNRLTSTSISQGQVFSYTYDRYGNRLSQTLTGTGSGLSPSFSLNANNNQITTPGFAYDAAGNIINDSSHSYTYDAEGNIIKVDGGTTATYYYNALNQRARADANGVSREYVFNASGQRVSVWDGNTHAQVQGQYYWGSTPVAFYSGGSLHFQHQDWMGTERVRTSYNGATQGSYSSLPFGDGFAVSGSDNDPYHFAQLDRDIDNGNGSDIEHAQFRQYSSTQGRWLSPDPYSGSYSFGDPQSFNRYAYVGNNPLSATDPSGLDGSPKPPDLGLDAPYGDCPSFPICSDQPLEMVYGPFGGGGGGGGVPASPTTPNSGTGPTWAQHGGFTPRPYPDPYSGLADIFGLPTPGCEFGACGGGFTQDGQWAGQAGRGRLQYGAASLLELLGVSIAYADLNDPNKRLYGTHYCGPGGGGSETGQVDHFCHLHDICYANAGITAGIQLGGGTDAQLNAMGSCNQHLCDALSGLSTPYGSQEREAQYGVLGYFRTISRRRCH